MNLLPFLTLFASTASLAGEPKVMEKLAVHGMAHIQSIVLTFAAWAIGGVIVGTLLSRLIGGNRTFRGYAVYSLCAFTGLCLGVFDFLGQLPWQAPPFAPLVSSLQLQ